MTGAPDIAHECYALAEAPAVRPGRSEVVPQIIALCPNGQGRTFVLLEGFNVIPVSDQRLPVRYGIERMSQHIGFPEKATDGKIQSDHNEEGAKQREKPGSSHAEHGYFPEHGKSKPQNAEWNEKNILSSEKMECFRLSQPKDLLPRLQIGSDP